MTAKDDNGAPVIYGVSHLDGVTPVQIMFDPVTRSIKVDTVTSIAFNPTLVTYQNMTGYPFALATSDANNTTIAPWVVNASTGAVLIET